MFFLEDEELENSCNDNVEFVAYVSIMIKWLTITQFLKLKLPRYINQEVPSYMLCNILAL